MNVVDIDKLIKIYRGKEIPEIELVEELALKKKMMVNVVRYFFLGKMRMPNPPFRGFLLYGPPGTGKTELVKQIARELDEKISNVFKVFLVIVDGASIAAPKWGDAEKILKGVFNESPRLIANRYNVSMDEIKLILLFDDIECFMLTRGADIAKEWHYSINSVLFHELDILDPIDTMFFATTNRIDLVDDAIKSRLYLTEISYVNINKLIPIIQEILDASGVDGVLRSQLTERVLERLKSLSNPTIRDAQKLTVIECIESGIWS